jgi:integrase/recombinase XerD
VDRSVPLWCENSTLVRTHCTPAMKVSAILKGRIDDLGRRTVFIRINEGTKRTFQSTGLKVHPKDFAKGRVKNSHPYASVLNAQITGHILNAEVQKGFVKEVVEALDFQGYCLNCLREWDKEKKPETLRQIKSEMNKIKNFAPSLIISELTPDFLNRYKTHLKAKKQTTNTQWKSFKFLRMISRKAKKEGKLKTNPFDQFSMPKYTDPRRHYLTKEQVEKLEAYFLLCPVEEKTALAWFLICCYTGLRFGDAVGFDKKRDVKSGRLVVYTSKTGEIVSMPLNEKLKPYFEAVDYKGLPYSNVHANRLIKSIAVHAEVNEKIHWHIARHTFATLAMSAGIRIDFVSKLLGHATIKTTSIYAKITNPALDKELDKLF